MCDSPNEERDLLQQQALMQALRELKMRSSRRDRSPSTSSLSSEEDEPKGKPAANGVKHVLINGKSRQDTERDKEDPCDPGMKNGLKHLYSGKENRKGRFQWQEEIPADIGDPVENDETAKWALLVRNVKVYNDPRGYYLSTRSSYRARCSRSCLLVCSRDT
jgi:hypothetical protein